MAEALADVITLLVAVSQLVMECRRIKPHTLFFFYLASVTLGPLTNYFLVLWVSAEEHKETTQNV